MITTFLHALQEAACRDPVRGAIYPLQTALIASHLPLEILELDNFPALLVPLHQEPKGLLSVHYDVVPCELQGSPATPALDETHVFGRGSSDVLGSAAALALALGDAREFWKSPPPLWVAFVGDEEYGGRDLAFSLNFCLRPPAGALSSNRQKKPLPLLLPGPSKSIST